MTKKKNRKIIVILGSKGMLGRQVSHFFDKDYKIIKIDKRIKHKNIEDVINKINKLKSSIVINCIGKIKQNKNLEKDIFFSNTILPAYLSMMLAGKHLLIHPSTDCVFNGKNKIFYKKNSKFNAVDLYGISKYLAENYLNSRKNTIILRVSIIGFSNKGGDLLTWALKNKNKKLFGYIDHYWNGITALEWCKIVKTYFHTYKKKENSKLLQIGTKKYITKYELLLIIKKTFNLKYRLIRNSL